MTTLLLIRHAHCDHIGHRLVGRIPGVRLSATGEREAAQLAARLASLPLAAIYASPLDRAQQTARAIARPHGLEVRRAEGLVELDYGDWTGLTMDEVRARPEWHRYSGSRSTVAVPNGEALPDAQARALAEVERLRRAHDGGIIAAVSHGDVIRAIIAHVACIPLDAVDRFEVLPARVSAVEMGDGWQRLRSLNALTVDG